MRIDYTKILKLLIFLTFITINTALVCNMVIKAVQKPVENTDEQTITPEDSGSYVEPLDQKTESKLKTESDQKFKVSDPAARAEDEPSHFRSSLIGGLLESTLSDDEFTVCSEGFYYAPLSDSLRKYITGNSFPRDTGASISISYEDLRYVHVWHYDFNGRPSEGELICNKLIAQDLTEIFLELYRNQYPIEKIVLMDEYFGDDSASMEDNNSSCFNYRNNTSQGSSALSLHAYGLAVDINPRYNPYVSANISGNPTFLPSNAGSYVDRSLSFEHKIDENDLCFRLFTEHGFVWGGSWSGAKDYQHFEKKQE